MLPATQNNPPIIVFTTVDLIILSEGTNRATFLALLKVGISTFHCSKSHILLQVQNPGFLEVLIFLVLTI